MTIEGTLAAIQEVDAAYRRAFDRRAAGYAKLHADFGYDYDADEWALPELGLTQKWSIVQGDLCYRGDAGVTGLLHARTETRGVSPTWDTPWDGRAPTTVIEL